VLSPATVALAGLSVPQALKSKMAAGLRPVKFRVLQIVFTCKLAVKISWQPVIALVTNPHFITFTVINWINA